MLDRNFVHLLTKSPKDNSREGASFDENRGSNGSEDAPSDVDLQAYETLDYDASRLKA